MSSSNNKRIAKNTGMLYIRMLLTMAISLYTSRIILNTLGVEDFGIYNVVGGFVIMFSLLNNAMASATQRFLSFEIGRKNNVQLRNVFSMSINIHIIIAFSIFIFAETVGLWFVNTQLTIPSERMLASQWVYQFSIFALITNMVSVPYNAIIIANERMSVFARVSIAEVSLKLLIVFMLEWFGFDKLRLYAVLMFAVVFTIRLIYGVYCRRNFEESKFRYYWNSSLYKTLMSFTGWNLFGTASGVFYGQGINVLLNIFFGPAVNAARGLAFQVKGAVYAFVSNFQVAINPQIIKSYASKDIKSMHQLIFQGAKFSYFLLFILTLPILFETKTILKLWLINVPEYSVIFTRLVIVDSLIYTITTPLETAVQAVGKIRKYQILVSGILLLILPISYMFFLNGFQPQSAFYIGITISIIALYLRINVVCPLINMLPKEYFSNVIIKVIKVSCLSIIIPLFVKQYIYSDLISLILISILTFLSSAISIYFWGLNNEDRIFIKKYLGNCMIKSKKNQKLSIFCRNRLTTK